MAAPHDKIITAAAKRALSPLGFRQKGRSRTWLADHGWWATVVEFQPSGWGKGSYLNVGAHWLWSESGHLSFDFGYRVEAFQPFESDAEFTAAAESLAEKAAARALDLARLFPSVSATADTLEQELVAMNLLARGSWPSLNAGIAAGLAGRSAIAIDLLTGVSDGRVKPLAERLAAHAGSPASFKPPIAALIEAQRTALDLPSLPDVPI